MDLPAEYLFSELKIMNSLSLILLPIHLETQFLSYNRFARRAYIIRI